MNIAATQYSLNTKSFEIYVAGCSGNCKGCHNPELKDFNVGQHMTTDGLKRMVQKIQEFDTLVDNIWVLGGEPLDQDLDDLKILLESIQRINKPIWLFTRYDLSNIPKDIKLLCDYIKTGAYLPELLSDDNTQFGITLATSNQKIHKINRRNLNE